MMIIYHCIKGKVIKEDTYAKVKRRAHIQGLVEPELARILYFLPRKVFIYMNIEHDFFSIFFS